MDFNSIALHVDGVNSKLSDIDYFVSMKEYLHDFKLDVAYPPYFKHNKFLAVLSNYLGPSKGGGFRNVFHQGLKEILKLFDMQLRSEGTILSLLESLKN